MVARVLRFPEIVVVVVCVYCVDCLCHVDCASRVCLCLVCVSHFVFALFALNVLLHCVLKLIVFVFMYVCVALCVCLCLVSRC